MFTDKRMEKEFNYAAERICRLDIDEDQASRDQLRELLRLERLKSNMLILELANRIQRSSHLPTVPPGGLPLSDDCASSGDRD